MIPSVLLESQLTNSEKTQLSNADERLIHIVGMYKCGTSWLAHVLAAHPEVIAWREFDIIRAVYKNRHAPIANRLINRLLRRLSLPPRQEPRQRLALKQREDVMRGLFCGRGLIPMMGEEKRLAADALDFSDSAQFLDQLIALGEYKVQSGDTPLLAPQNFSNTLGIVNSRRKDLLRFIEQVRDTNDLSQVPNFYFEYLQGQCLPGTPVVLKAADQIMCLDQLQASSPLSTKIVIMRDGRDAAISALHFGELMKKWDAPWQAKPLNYHDRLRGWAIRASALAHQCAQHDILVLRYEDLQRDFTATCRALFRRLGISSENELIDSIYAQTNFSAVTGGRQPGQAAEDIVRKGMIGEWKETLSPAEAREAWQIAHIELARFGYTESGEYQKSALCNLVTLD
jgi:hypothetical protein